MNGERTRPGLSTTLSSASLQPVLRDVVVVGVLVIVLGLTTVLPGGGRTIPNAGFTVGDLALGLVTAGIVASVLHVAPAVGDLVRFQVRGPDDLVEDLAAAAQYLVVFVAVVVAHRGFAAVLVPLLGPDAGWTFDVVFLGFALFTLAVFGYRLYRNADDLADWLAATLVSRSPEDSTDGPRRSAGRGTGSDE